MIRSRVPSRADEDDARSIHSFIVRDCALRFLTLTTTTNHDDDATRHNASFVRTYVLSFVRSFVRPVRSASSVTGRVSSLIYSQFQRERPGRVGLKSALVLVFDFGILGFEFEFEFDRDAARPIETRG